MQLCRFFFIIYTKGSQTFSLSGFHEWACASSARRAHQIKLFILYSQTLKLWFRRMVKRIASQCSSLLALEDQGTVAHTLGTPDYF